MSELSSSAYSELTQRMRIWSIGYYFVESKHYYCRMEVNGDEKSDKIDEENENVTLNSIMGHNIVVRPRPTKKMSTQNENCGKNIEEI